MEKAIFLSAKKQMTPSVMERQHEHNPHLTEDGLFALGFYISKIKYLIYIPITRGSASLSMCA